MIWNDSDVCVYDLKVIDKRLHITGSDGYDVCIYDLKVFDKRFKVSLFCMICLILNFDVSSISTVYGYLYLQIW